MLLLGRAYNFRLCAEGRSGLRQKRGLFKVQDLHLGRTSYAADPADTLRNRNERHRWSVGLKGYSRVDKGGDLTLIPAGAIDFAIAVSPGTPISPTSSGPPPAINATMWTGAQGGGELMPAVPDGTLVLEFVDRAANRVVWSGKVSQKLDIEKKTKSLELASKAVAKLLKQFPPKAKN